MKIELAHDLKLPLDVVTQAVGILAKRRAGKSYTARRLVEQLLGKNMQTVVVDPKGDWWGLRSAADGKRPGFPIVILGGEHGDVALEVSGGELVANGLLLDEPKPLASPVVARGMNGLWNWDPPAEALLETEKG